MFSQSQFVVGSPSSPTPNNTTTIDAGHTNYAENDVAVRDQPLRYIDYLSLDWNRVDIWPSWKHIIYSNSARLENALCRAWTASRYRLKRVPPETLNWLKDYTAWLYGPLQTSSLGSLSHDDGDGEDGDIYAIRGGDEDDDGMVAVGFFVQAVDVVNAAKDIAYVLWNVGWR